MKLNDFEKNVQSKRNDAVDSAVGFVVSFGFFAFFVRDGNSHPSYRLLAAFRAAVNRQSFFTSCALVSSISYGGKTENVPAPFLNLY